MTLVVGEPASDMRESACNLEYEVEDNLHELEEGGVGFGCINEVLENHMHSISSTTVALSWVLQHVLSEHEVGLDLVIVIVIQTV